ncbi:hypothetical protein [Kitasatospora brasiliensis]|uniref:hypothetical protein n=1 Tax=Kitasatospora brasiliensis TaxID=3058040 RepID=UPI00292F3530|nr:hypothetical protein [Kitasatospora sp. K002]
MTDTPELETFRTALREELVLLWGDLLAATDQAINGTWSIRCDALVARITKITMLIGPADWREVPMTIVENGLYEQIHTHMGVSAPVDHKALARTRAGADELNRRAELSRRQRGL